MTPRPHRPGSTTQPASTPIDLDLDLSTLDVTELKTLQHGVEGELARIEPSEPAGATAGQLAEHGTAAADPDRSRRLRQMLVAIDDAIAGRTDTSEMPTGE